MEKKSGKRSCPLANFFLLTINRNPLCAEYGWRLNRHVGIIPEASSFSNQPCKLCVWELDRRPWRSLENNVYKYVHMLNPHRTTTTNHNILPFFLYYYQLMPMPTTRLLLLLSIIILFFVCTPLRLLLNSFLNYISSYGGNKKSLGCLPVVTEIDGRTRRGKKLLGLEWLIIILITRRGITTTRSKRGE